MTEENEAQEKLIDATEFMNTLFNQVGVQKEFDKRGYQKELDNTGLKTFKVKFSGTISIAVNARDKQSAINEALPIFDHFLYAFDEFEGFTSWIEDGVEATEVEE